MKSFASGSEKKLQLFGETIQGSEFMIFEFTDNQFSPYFGKESEFKSIASKALKPFDPKSGIFPNEQNENIMIVSDKNCIHYSYTKANGPWPERYQSSDDLTEWINNDVGIKKLSDIIENYKAQDFPGETKDSYTSDFNNHEDLFDAIYISSFKTHMSTEIGLSEDVDWGNVEVSISGISFDNEDFETTTIKPIKCRFNGFEAIKSEEDNSYQFWLTFETVQIIVENDLIGNNLSLLEEKGFYLEFEIKKLDGEQVDYDLVDGKKYYDFQVDLSEPMNVIEENF